MTTLRHIDAKMAILVGEPYYFWPHGPNGKTYLNPRGAGAAIAGLFDITAPSLAPNATLPNGYYRLDGKVCIGEPPEDPQHG
jgi:hypothetical protein